jgi:serine/threonine-protein kinase SRPK3
MGDTFQCLARTRHQVGAHYFYSIFSFRFCFPCRQQHARQRHVAIKILSTHATEVQGRLANELDILQRISSENLIAHPGRRHVASLLDNFMVTDRHGPHLCLVFEALGIFKHFIYHGSRLPVPFVKNIVRQRLLALDFLHRECRIVHTGKIVVAYVAAMYSLTPSHAVPKDLKPDNILIKLPNAAKAIQRYTSGVSEPEAMPTMPDSSIPVVLSRPIIPFSSDEPQNANYLPSNCEVQLTDFGTGKQ